MQKVVQKSMLGYLLVQLQKPSPGKRDILALTTLAAGTALRQCGSKGGSKGSAWRPLGAGGEVKRTVFYKHWWAALLCAIVVLKRLLGPPWMQLRNHRQAT